MRKGISLRALTVASLALLPLTSLQARNIRVDFDPSAFESSGSGWSFSSINLFGPSALPGSGSLQFALSGSYDPDSDPGTNNDVSYDFQPVAPLQVGSSLYASFCMFANGTFTLSQSGDCSGSAGVDPTFGLLPIAGLSPREGAQPTDSGSMFSTNGFGVGIPDEGQPDFTGPYNIADAVPTVRLWWNDVAESYDEFGNAVGPSYSVQAFIYMLGDGNFDLDVRYGTNGGSFSGIERSFCRRPVASDSTAVVKAAILLPVPQRPVAGRRNDWTTDFGARAGLARVAVDGPDRARVHPSTSAKDGVAEAPGASRRCPVSEPRRRLFVAVTFSNLGPLWTRSGFSCLRRVTSRRSD